MVVIILKKIQGFSAKKQKILADCHQEITAALNKQDNDAVHYMIVIKICTMNSIFVNVILYSLKL